MKKIFSIVIYTILFAGLFGGCSKMTDENLDAGKSPTTIVPNENEQDYNKLFEFNIYSDKSTYKTTDKIKIWATIKYIGSENQITIWSGDPYISFIITDGKDFNTGGIILTTLISTVLEKDKLYEFNYTKNGGYSAEDPNADFWEKFYKEKDLYLPKGEYTITSGGAFSLTKDSEKSKSNLKKELKINVED